MISKFKKELGLDKCKYLSVGAEPLHKETHDFFLELELSLLELYGMSESTLPQTTNLDGARKLGSCGHSTSGVQVEIVNRDEYKESQFLHLNKPKNNVGEVSILIAYQNVFTVKKGCPNKL